MKKIKIYFVESPHQSKKILGREAKDYLFKEFEGVEFQIVKEISQIDFLWLPVAVLSLDMPAVTKEYIDRLLESAGGRNISKVVIGDESKGFCLCLGRGKNTYFVKDDLFLQLDSAKNWNIVYNTLRKRKITRLLEDEVIIEGEDVHVDDTVTVEGGAILRSPITLKGNTVIKAGAVVENSIILDSVIESGANVTCSHLVSSLVGENTTVGPFARLREATIDRNCRIGDFVEVKNSTFESGVKCAHLAYVGDAVVGEKTNVGCGSVFCNYDGKHKHHTQVGKGVFIGANVNLVAPLKVGDGTYIAAGTTVTKDTDDNGFVIGRVRQENKETKKNNQT